MIIILCHTLYAQHATLTLQQPKQLQSLFPTSGIPLYITNIGSTQKGLSLKGDIIFPYPQNACSYLETDSSIDNIHKPIFIVNNSNCSYVTKAKNIQNGGAFVGLIQRSFQNYTKQKYTGKRVNIPIVQINKQDGDIIKRYHNQNPQSKISGTVLFEVPNNTKIQLHVWFSSPQKQVYTFLKEFYQFYLELKQYITITPHYILIAKNKGDKQQNYINCLSSGKYCAPDLQYQQGLASRNIVWEDLRQIIISQNFPQQWWLYMKYFGEDCISQQFIFEFKQDLEICSNEAMSKAKISKFQVNNYMMKSFKGDNPNINDNQYLLQQMQMYQSQHIESYPQLIINHKKFKSVNLYNQDDLGQSTQDVKIAICKYFGPDYNTACKKVSDKFSYQSTPVVLIIISVLLGLFLTFTCVLQFYKRYLKTRFFQQANYEVVSRLSNYYEQKQNLQN